jgi:hypothetical protein
MIIHARAKRKETSGTEETVEEGFTVRKALAVVAAKFLCFQPTKPNQTHTSHCFFALETKLRERERDRERGRLVQPWMMDFEERTKDMD